MGEEHAWDLCGGEYMYTGQVEVSICMFGIYVEEEHALLFKVKP